MREWDGEERGGKEERGGVSECQDSGTWTIPSGLGGEMTHG